MVFAMFLLFQAAHTSPQCAAIWSRHALTQAGLLLWDALKIAFALKDLCHLHSHHLALCEDALNRSRMSLAICLIP